MIDLNDTYFLIAEDEHCPSYKLNSIRAVGSKEKLEAIMEGMQNGRGTSGYNKTFDHAEVVHSSEVLKNVDEWKEWLSASFMDEIEEYFPDDD